MITSLNKIYKKTHLIVSESPLGFEIQTGELLNPEAFIKDKTILISGERPNLLWDLLHNLVGIPHPQLNIVKPEKAAPKEKAPVLPELEMSPLEKELNTMSSREILKKIETEKGITLTLSPKSKKAIIKRALQIYS